MTMFKNLNESCGRTYDTGLEIYEFNRKFRSQQYEVYNISEMLN